ncbi:MAG: diguanylate cyclase [Spirulinaceae cyanobacterium]
MVSISPENFIILVVDDISHNLSVIGSILEEVGYDTTFATSGEQALERLENISPDLVLLDLMMPGMSGLEVCKIIKSQGEWLDLPIIFLTAIQEKESLLQAFEQGAVDYITKPFHAPELLARVRLHLELKETRDRLHKSLKEQARLTAALEKLAHIDPLTEVWNRRYFEEIAQREFTRAQRYQRLFSVLMLDIDYFKKINDTYGHIVGDEILKALAKVSLNNLRKTDYLGRFGGEEFIAILPETARNTALEIAQRLREAIAQMVVPYETNLIQITVSIGVTTYHPRDDEFKKVLARSDNALYAAKNQGRNCVVEGDIMSS